MDIKVPADLFTITHTFSPEDFAPGVWAGCEGLKLVITKIDLEARTITLELDNNRPKAATTPKG